MPIFVNYTIHWPIVTANLATHLSSAAAPTIGLHPGGAASRLLSVHVFTRQVRQDGDADRKYNGPCSPCWPHCDCEVSFHAVDKEADASSITSVAPTQSCMGMHASEVENQTPMDEC